MKDLLKRVINWFRWRFVLTKLDVKNGDILIAKYKSSLVYSHDWPFWRDLRKALDKRNMRDTQIMCLAKDCDLQSINEALMNKAGWFRKTVNPGRDELLLNAYREKRDHDGVDGRVYDVQRFSEAEKCISSLESVIELEAYRRKKS